MSLDAESCHSGKQARLVLTHLDGEERADCFA